VLSINHQIDRIKAEAAARQVDVTIVVDFAHVLEYLWKAAWCFFDEGDPDAERWVRDRARAILKGQAAGVAASLRQPSADAAARPAPCEGSQLPEAVEIRARLAAGAQAT
jgi:hypothetical protein